MRCDLRNRPLRPSRRSLQRAPGASRVRLTRKGSDLFVGLNALRQWGDRYLRAEPMRLLWRKSDQTPVVAALVPEGRRCSRTTRSSSCPDRLPAGGVLGDVGAERAGRGT